MTDQPILVKFCIKTVSLFSDIVHWGTCSPAKRLPPYSFLTHKMAQIPTVNVETCMTIQRKFRWLVECIRMINMMENSNPNHKDLKPTIKDMKVHHDELIDLISSKYGEVIGDLFLFMNVFEGNIINDYEQAHKHDLFQEIKDKIYVPNTPDTDVGTNRFGLGQSRRNEIFDEIVRVTNRAADHIDYMQTTDLIVSKAKAINDYKEAYDEFRQQLAILLAIRMHKNLTSAFADTTVSD